VRLTQATAACDLARWALAGSGHLVCDRCGRTAECTFELAQLFNGRLSVEVRLPLERGTATWVEHCGPFSLAGSLDDGRPAEAHGMITDSPRLAFRERVAVVKGYLYYPGHLLIGANEGELTSCREMLCEVTNLLLYHLPTCQASTRQAHLEFQRVGDHYDVERLTRACRTGGVLCEIRLVFAQDTSVERMDEFIDDLCGLLSLSQRTHVWPVARHGIGPDGAVLASRYREPLFYYSRPSRPLIPAGSLALFVETAIDAYVTECEDWNLQYAEDLYIQAMSLHSVWPQSVGFFTALESLKAAYLRQRGDEAQYYVPPDAEYRKRFKTKKVGYRINDVLCEAFDAFCHLSGEHRASLRSKARTELNRRPYKQVLKAMFTDLGVGVEDEDLKLLVRLRDQIIHTGSPKYGAAEPWSDTDTGEASKWVSRFAGLLERTLLAILEYSGDFEPYDESFAPITP
jgi:hypothetical protein